MYLSSDLIECHTDLGYGVQAYSPIPQGEVIFELTGTFVSVPARYTIQVDRDRHIAPHGRLWSRMNHSCTPNCRIDFSSWTAVTTRFVPAGEELTFNYLTTEWELSEPFACACGSPRCYGMIRGFRRLSPTEMSALVELCSPYLKERYAAMAAAVSLTAP